MAKKKPPEKWITKDNRTLNFSDLDKQHLENILKVMKHISVQKKIPMKDVRVGKNNNVTYLDVKRQLKDAKPPAPKEDAPEDFMDMIEL